MMPPPGGAKSARIEITGTAGELGVQISDNGVGFDPESAPTRDGLGLLSMRERLWQVNGTISFMRIKPTGTQIDIRVPVVVAAGQQRSFEGIR